MTTYSVFAIGAAATGTGTLNPAVPAGTLTGKLMLLCAAASTATETITTPSGYTLIKQGSVNGFAIFGKIGTVSESAPSVTFSGSGGHAAFIVALTSSDGWPAIGSVLVDSSSGNNSSGITGGRYGSLTVTRENLCGVQFMGKNTTTGGATAVAVTSGYTAAGTAFNNGAGGITIGAQLFNGSPTVATGMAQNDVAITGNTQSTLSHRRISLSFAPASVSYAHDASSRIDSPYNGLSLALLTGMAAKGDTAAFESGDTYDYNGTPPSGVTVADFGEITITAAAFTAAGGTITLPMIFRDANGSGDGIYTYSVVFSMPVNAMRAGGTWGFTGTARLRTINNIRAGINWGFQGGAYLTITGGRNVPFDGNLNDAALIPVIFADLGFDSAHLYVHTDLGTITTGGHDWLGVGSFASISGIEETDDGTPTGMSLTLSGIDTTILTAALTEAYMDRPVVIYLAVRDMVTGAISSLHQLASMKMDSMVINAGNETARISLNTESEWINFDKSLMRYLSDSNEQLNYPGALGLIYLDDMINAKITIGSKQTLTFGVDSK